MTATLTDGPPPAVAPGTATRGSTAARERVAFGAIVAVSLWLNGWALSQNGLGNTFYAAATWSATTSMRNWFFGALDPGGFITVDKPPVALWIEGLSARLFGFSAWSILFPSAIAGAVSVALIWWIVRPRFGVLAAAISAALLAISPINVAVNRLNLPDPFMIAFLLGAAWAVLRASAATRWVRWVVLAGVLVGLAFNTKMLAAAIPGPALALGLLVGTPGPLWGRVKRLLVFGLATLAFAVPWIIAVDLTPATSRPYMGGSTNNRVEDLVFGYNGLGRVEGNTQGGGGQFGGNAFGAGFAGIGGVFGGEPGTARLVNSAVGGQVAWLLPLAIGGGAFSIWQFRRDRRRLAAALLWFGWITITAVVFSYAKGTFHSYYTAALAPAVAALVGMGVAAVRDALRTRGWSTAVAVVGSLLTLTATVLLQGRLAGRVGDFYADLRPIVIGGAVAAGVLLVVAVVARAPRIVVTGALVLGVASVALTPAAWSMSEVANPTLNATLPQAGPRGGVAASTFGARPAASAPGASPPADQLADYLRANSEGTRWDLVTTSAMTASDLIADQHLSVMALGGFIGTDPATTPARVARQVRRGEVRFFLAGGFGGFGGAGPGDGGPPGGGLPGGITPGALAALLERFQPRPNRPGGAPNGPGVFPGGGLPGGFGGGTAESVMAIVRSTCTPVTDPAVPAQYRSQLYDCAGKGNALIAAATAQSDAAAAPTP